MKALRFLELAQRLFDNDPSPESRRSVISRAYYGAFGTALEFLAAMGVPLPKRISEHEKVPDLLESSEITNLMTAGQMLDTLRRQRNDADYDFANTDVEDRNFVEQRLKDAKRIVGLLSACLLGKDTPGTEFDRARAPIQKESRRLFLGVR